MNRQDKINVVESLHNEFAQSQAAFIVGIKGLTVSQMQNLRKELRKKGSKLKIAKARLMKIAVQDIAGAEELKSYFKDEIGLVFAPEQAPAVAQVLHNFSKDNAALHVVGGYFDSMVLNNESVVRIASLPSKEVLLSQVCGTLKAPTVGLVSVLNAITTQLVWTLKQIGEKKQ